MRTVLVVTELAVQYLHDCQTYIQTDKVSQGKRAHGMVGTELHGRVYVIAGSHSVCQNTHSLVYHRDEYAVDNKARSLVDRHRCLAYLLTKSEYGIEYLL